MGDRVASVPVAAATHAGGAADAGDGGEGREASREASGGICRGWLRLSDPEMLPAPVCGILRRKCDDRIRGLSARRTRSVPVETAPEQSEAALVPLCQEMITALGRLSTALLYVSDSLTRAETAATKRVPVATSKSHIFHARQHL
ncbi:MAG: RNA polymerase sigma factor [Hyphomonas sp.]